MNSDKDNINKVQIHSQYRKQIEEDKNKKRLLKKKKRLKFIIFGIILGIAIVVASVSVYFIVKNRSELNKKKAFLGQ